MSKDGQVPPRADGLSHERPGSRLCQRSDQLAMTGGLLEHSRVGAPFQKFIVRGVDDEQIGLMPRQLFHHDGNSVTGIADASRVENFPIG